MSDSVDRVFVHALNTVKKIPRTGSARPPPSDRLKLYGLYKQSMEGDVEGVMSRPEGDSEEIRAEREKWTAWSAQHGLSRTEAKRRYITTLISTMHNYASNTPEARELVAELEFVWDQIKSNSISSSASSPDQRPTLPQSRSYNTSIPPDRPGLGSRRDDPDGGLRSLRPVSDGDEEEVEVDDNDNEDDDFADPQAVFHAHDSDPAAQQADGDSSTRLYEIRNRKWRKRMEQALMRLTTEVAALREQLEAKRFLQRQQRENAWAWLRWLLWVAVRHLVVDALVWGVVVIWVRRRGVDNLERRLGGLVEVVRERAGRVRVPGLRRLLRRA